MHGARAGGGEEGKRVTFIQIFSARRAMELFNSEEHSIGLFVPLHTYIQMIYNAHNVKQND